MFARSHITSRIIIPLYNKLSIKCLTIHPFNSQWVPNSNFSSSVENLNLKTFHSSKKELISNKRKTGKTKHKTLYIIVGLTVLTSIASILHERKDLKPKEFLE